MLKYCNIDDNWFDLFKHLDTVDFVVCRATEYRTWSNNAETSIQLYCIKGCCGSLQTRIVTCF